MGKVDKRVFLQMLLGSAALALMPGFLTEAAFAAEGAQGAFTATFGSTVFKGELSDGLQDGTYVLTGGVDGNDASVWNFTLDGEISGRRFEQAGFAIDGKRHLFKLVLDNMPELLLEFADGDGNSGTVVSQVSRESNMATVISAFVVSGALAVIGAQDGAETVVHYESDNGDVATITIASGAGEAVDTRRLGVVDASFGEQALTAEFFHGVNEGTYVLVGALNGAAPAYWTFSSKALSPDGAITERRFFSATAAVGSDVYIIEAERVSGGRGFDFSDADGHAGKVEVSSEMGVLESIVANIAVLGLLTSSAGEPETTVFYQNTNSEKADVTLVSGGPVADDWKETLLRAE